VSGLLTALRTLTILPVPGREEGKFGVALPFFSTVGLILGLLLSGVALLAQEVGRTPWPEGVALLLLAGGIVLTRGLHLDGLADWADGFFGGVTPRRRLEIMKDPRKGSFGVIALILVLLAKYVALARLAACDQCLWIVCAYVVSRTVMADLIVRLPYARAEDGTAGPFVREARPWMLWVCALMAAAFLVGLYGPVGLLPLLAGGLFARLFGWWCRRAVNGITGDLLGAAGELTETGLLLAAAAAAPWLNRLQDLARNVLKSY